ncbi:hypothetical protein [Rhizobium leguminosarum]|uniref:hypothetical protein n=1 Tax=Rhizobium leguminosarum TaxID=384 RepID=UPI001C90F83E|nr:hypothetical protein [Rhizobium leguminosarum]MBY2949483.1 hypothetical protein [Rhizobium leguminosarum]
MPADFERLIRASGMASCDPKQFGPWATLIETTLERFRRLSDSRSAAHATAAHQIAIGYSDDNDFNAFADTIQGEDIIAIAQNVPISLALLFKRAMLFRGIMPWVGKFDNSHVDPEPITAEDILFALDNRPPHPPGELDELRTKLAHLMTGIALDFVFLHEMGHVWNGHTSLFRNRYGLRLTEIERGKKVPLSPIDRQTLEMDADCYAGRLMATYPTPEKDWLPVNPGWEKEFGEGSTFLIIRNFAIYLAMRCFNDAASLENIENSNYPPVALRQYFVMGTWFVALNKDTGRDQAELIRLALPIIGAGELAFSLLTGNPVDDSGVKLAYSAEGIEYATSLLRNWAKLHPDLDPLKRGGALAPVQF